MFGPSLDSNTVISTVKLEGSEREDLSSSQKEQSVVRHGRRAVGQEPTGHMSLLLAEGTALRNRG